MSLAINRCSPPLRSTVYGQCPEDNILKAFRLLDGGDESKFQQVDMPQRVLLVFQLGMLALDFVDDRFPTEAGRQVLSLALEEAKLSLGDPHVSKGPDDLDAYGYSYVRLYWTGFGLPANIVEEYILLSIVLHTIVGLRRTWNRNNILYNNLQHSQRELHP